MELFNSTGKNLSKSEVLLVTKSIGEVLLATTVDIDDLVDEQISIEVERLRGNLQITKGFMSLRDFILLTTFNADAVTSDPTYKTTAVCEICENGSIELVEKDVIKIQLIGLDPAEAYVLNGIEMPSTSNKTLSFDNKSMAADEKTKSFDVEDCDLLLIDNNDAIEEISYTYLNGVTVRYTLHELRIMARAVDPVAYVKQNGNVKSGFASKLQLPLFSAQQIEVRKSQGTVINLIQRLEAN